MRKNLVTAAGIAVFAAGITAAYAFTAPGGGVLGSKHDINAYADSTTGVTKDPQDRVCAFCHTPHHAMDPTQAPSADYLPLWSHETNNETNFNPYFSPTLQAQIDDPLIGPSRLCMSCHDGQIAIDTHYNIKGTKVLTGDSYGQVAVGQKNAGGEGDLSNDHPIGFNYLEVVQNDHGKGIKDETNTFKNGKTALKISDVLYDGTYMTCASCHDVHNKDNVSHNPSVYNYFVYAPQKNSDLCLSCHDK